MINQHNCILSEPHYMFQFDWVHCPMYADSKFYKQMQLML